MELINRTGNAVSTTTRLIALFRITADSAAKPKIPISSGRQTELGTAETDQPAEDSDSETGGDY